MTSVNLPKDGDAQVLTSVRLYVAGGSPNSVTALANVQSLLERYPGHHITLEVIDVVRDPGRGVRDGVLVTPMLVKAEPLPERRVLGNLQDRDMLRSVLGLHGTSSE
jgi:circadian clock protein KaiB